MSVVRTGYDSTGGQVVPYTEDAQDLMWELNPLESIAKLCFLLCCTCVIISGSAAEFLQKYLTDLHTNTIESVKSRT